MPHFYAAVSFLSVTLKLLKALMAAIWAGVSVLPAGVAAPADGAVVAVGLRVTAGLC